MNWDMQDICLVSVFQVLARMLARLSTLEASDMWPCSCADGRPCCEQTCTVTSSLAATRGSQAMLEAAVSSAICHPNIVQTYDYQVVDMYQSATMLRTEANRVGYPQRILPVQCLSVAS